MNDDARFERLIADGPADLSPSSAPRDLTSNIKADTGRMRPRPRWLALIKEPPMRTHSTLVVGSPTTRVAALVAAMLLATIMTTGAMVAGAQLLTGPGIIVVAQDGSGDFTTIGDAVRKARDGTTIVVRPGTYSESVRVAKDVQIVGDDREAVIVSASDDGPWAQVGEAGLRDGTSPYAFHLVDTTATLSDLTLRGPNSVVLAVGGAPTLLDLTFDGVRPVDENGEGGDAIVISGGSEAVVRGNHLVGRGPIGVFDRSEPDIDSNVLEGGANINGAFGERAIVRGNTITDPASHGIRVVEPTTMRIDGNTITAAPIAGIMLGFGWADGVDPEIVGNTIRDSRTGIWLESGAEPTIEGNAIELGPDQVYGGTGDGIRIRSSSPHILDNEFVGDGLAIGVQGGSPMIERNTFRDIGWPVQASDSSSPGVAQNTICGPLDQPDWRTEFAEFAADNRFCPEP